MKKKLLIIDILVILLLGLLSLTWFRGSNLIGGGDFGMPLDWVKYLKLMPFVWDETVSLGHADYRQAASLIPYALLGAGLQSLDFSLVWIEKIFFFIWFAGSGLSMYYLCRVLKMPRLGKLAASIFYMFNPFSLIIIWRVSHGLIQMPYAFAPLILGLFINGLKNKKDWQYIIIANFIWLITTASAYANPKMAIIHWLIIGFFFFWHLVFVKKSRLFTTRYALKFIVFWMLFNSYWLLPFITSLRESFASAHSPFLMPDIEQLKLTSVKLIDGIRMLGYWSLQSGYKGEPYYQYWQYYDLIWIKLISWLIPGLVILGIWEMWRQKKQDKVLIFFLLSLVIFSLLGINGAYPPLGGLVVWLYRLLPLFGALVRFNFLFFGLPAYLGFAILLGYGFQKINRFFRWPLLVLLCVILVWPFWTGDVIKSKGKINPGERFQVPDYWLQAKNWLADQENFFRILPLPMSKTYNITLDWGEGYSGGDLMRWLTPQPVLNANTGDTFQVPMLIGEVIEKKTSFKDIAKLLGFLNVKYLLVRGDAQWQALQGHGWWFDHPPEKIEEFIKNQPALSLAKEIGKLKFYQLKDDYLLPRFYSPRQITKINGEVKSLISLAQFLKPENKEAVLLVDDEPSDFIWRQPSEPGVYQINVAEAGDYHLLFRDDGLLRFYKDQKASLQIDNNETEERIFRPIKDNLLSLGKIKLTAGAHRLNILPKQAINLIIIPGGHQVFKITAKKEEKLTSFPFQNFQSGEIHSLFFKTRNLQGQPPFLLIWENYTDLLEPRFENLNHPFGVANLKTNFSKFEIPLNTSWQEFNLTFHPNPPAKSVGLSFISQFGENWFSDLEVKRVFNNPLLLRNLSLESRLLKPPKISWEKISPVKYKVEIKNAEEPFWLVFSESFHPGWEASVQGKHTIINGFANGWYFEKTGDYQLDIFFAPQRIFYLGAGISLLTFLFSLVYLTRCYLFRF